MKHTVIDTSGATGAEADGPRLLHDYFERQAQLRPEQMAVECNGEVVSYGELDAMAQRVAAYLRLRGVAPGSLVGLCMRKSCRLFAAMLGILKAGAGYVPIDTKTPVDRIRAIIDDANIPLLLCEAEQETTFGAEPPAELGFVGNILNENWSVPDVPVVITPADVAYVIYTSGSTGKPKGVVIEHRNAANFVHALPTVYGLAQGDRVYQGFSIAFDASIEEIWAAFSLGGTLVVPTEDVARSTLDAGDFINAQGVTFFSTVPSFLALIRQDLPTVRLLVLGGEVCAPELIARWARNGRRVLNTYGPTEATVVATAAECVAGRPVTIGKALPGYETYVLDDQRRPVAVGEIGELYLGGKGVARGYLNRPELTQERFIANPFDRCGSSRLYRSFDLVRPNEDGTLQFLGRADDQIKIRGFRIELSEIEAVLLEHSSVAAAAVAVTDCENLKEIAAYVVPLEQIDDAARAEIGDLVRRRLPEYMVPKYLDVIAQLPTMTSGKVDRKRLPPPRTIFARAAAATVPPSDALERAVADVWERAFGISPISVEQDFFLDLHGHSLLAAKVVTELRTKLDTLRISVRDIYEYPTVRLLGQHLRNAEAKLDSSNSAERPVREQESAANPLPPLPRTRWLCVGMQALSLLAYYAVVSAPLVLAVLLVTKVFERQMAWDDAAGIATIAGFAVWPSWLLLSIAIKWIVIGRFKPGRYPVWGLYYFRWWLVTLFQSLSWSEMFIGTPLMSLYYRAMGAKVGRNCMIGTPICGAFDLVVIGEGTSIGSDSHLLGYRVEDGCLVLGRVNIGRECFVGMHCSLGLDATLRDGARLDDMSHLSDGTTMEEGEGRRGCPAERACVDVPRCERRPRTGAGILFGLVHLALIYAMGYVLIVSAAPAILAVGYVLFTIGPAWAIATAFASVPFSILWYLLLVVAIKRIAIGRIFPGFYSLHSVAYLRYWFMNYLLNNTRHLALALYATVFFPQFLRWLGARIGRGVEVSTIMHAMPDLLDIGEGSFLADACIIGGSRVNDGVLELQSNRIGRRTFVGNSALVPAGVCLGQNGLVGVMSTPPAGVRETPDGSRWLGAPGFELPAIQKTACFSTHETFEPGPSVVLLRASIDLLRVFLPGVLTMAVTVAFCAIVVLAYQSLPLWQLMLAAPVSALALSFASLLAVAALKWLIMGRFKPTVKPLWCSYVWFNEVVNGLFESVAAPVLAPLMGTPFVALGLRWMGSRVGRWTFVNSTLFSEFDLVDIGDRAALNLGCTVQTHLFEDRIMKADFVRIGEGCSIGNMAIVLYGTNLRKRSWLGPLSVLMKGESLPEASRWCGIPTQPMALAKPAATGRHAAPVRSRQVSRHSGRRIRKRLLGPFSPVALRHG